MGGSLGKGLEDCRKLSENKCNYAHFRYGLLFINLNIQLLSINYLLHWKSYHAGEKIDH